MKYVRFTLLWGALFSAVSFGSSVVNSTGLFAETRVGDSMIYPVFRFFQGGAFASVTEKTLERVFADRLKSDALEDVNGLERKLAHHLYGLCVENRMDPAFVLSVIQVESSFKVDAISRVGAVGLMQIMPQTARVVARKYGIPGAMTKKSLIDPFLNLTLGVTYLRELRERYDGLSPYFHLAAYNMGPNRLDRLRARPHFKPGSTLKYYEDIMKGVNGWRFYLPRQVEEAAIQARPAKVKLAQSA